MRPVPRRDLCTCPIAMHTPVPLEDTRSLLLESTLINNMCAPTSIQERNVTPKKYLKKQKGKFLKGPIPMTWLNIAGNLPGKALHIGIALWHWSWIRRTKTFKLPTHVYGDLGVGRKSYYNGLQVLEKAELISVQRSVGKKPEITLRSLDLPTSKILLV